MRVNRLPAYTHRAPSKVQRVHGPHLNGRPSRRTEEDASQHPLIVPQNHVVLHQNLFLAVELNVLLALVGLFYPKILLEESPAKLW